LNNSSFHEICSRLNQQSDIFKYVSTTNKIINVEVFNWSPTLEQIQLFFNLFPQLEYFKIAIDKKEFEQVIRFLFSKTTNKPRHLFFLCILRLPKRCLRELNMLIKSENLLDDYFIKFLNHDLYLWW